MISFEVADINIASLLKMNGFSDVQTTEHVVVARKPVFKAGGTSLKARRNEAPQEVKSSNPWANLQ